MPISSHCFCRAGDAALAPGKADRADGLGDRVLLCRPELRAERPEDAARAFLRQLEILEDGKVLEHGRLLEFAADAEVGDLRLVEARQVVGAVEEDGAGIGARLAGDNVHHGRLAGAVGTDDRADLAAPDEKGQRVQRLEAVEADGYAIEIEERIGGGGIAHGARFSFAMGAGAGDRSLKRS
jgi:hypothetical protein